jgi:hypothetical protein
MGIEYNNAGMCVGVTAGYCLGQSQPHDSHDFPDEVFGKSSMMQFMYGITKKVAIPVIENDNSPVVLYIYDLLNHLKHLFPVNGAVIKHTLGIETIEHITILSISIVQYILYIFCQILLIGNRTA